MRTPPVRDASTKPSAATVLPAPVACSNQKRRPRVRVLGRLAELLLVVVGAGLVPVLRLLGLVVLVELLLAGEAHRRQHHVGVGDGPVGGAVAVALGLGVEGGQRAGQRVDLMGGQDGPVG